jgi:circadian clock protein KaiB
MKSTRLRSLPMPLSLRLYVAGESPNSALARANLQAALTHVPKADVTLEVIDILLHPERGFTDGVLVTPTLIRLGPAPEQRVIGNLRDRNALLAGLGMNEAGDERARQ